MADKEKLNAWDIKKLPKMIIDNLRDFAVDMMAKVSNKVSSIAPSADVPPKPTLDLPWPDGTLKKTIKIPKESEFKDLEGKADALLSDLQTKNTQLRRK